MLIELRGERTNSRKRYSIQDWNTYFNLSLYIYIYEHFSNIFIYFKFSTRCGAYNNYIRFNKTTGVVRIFVITVGINRSSVLYPYNTGARVD